MLKARFTDKDIAVYLAKKVELIHQAIINRLQALGEECINNARLEGSYTDQTGNLRASIGYIIVSNGKVVKRSSYSGSFGKGGAEGKKAARDLLDELVSKYSSGIALIVVAGMNYAAKVESMGKNVLSSAEHYAEAELPGMLKQLKSNIRKMK